MNSVLIDEDRIMAPFHVLKNKVKEEGRQYSDHNPVIVTFRVSYREVRKTTTIKVENAGWKINESGMKRFAELTTGGKTPSKKTSPQTQIFRTK